MTTEQHAQPRATPSLTALREAVLAARRVLEPAAVRRLVEAVLEASAEETAAAAADPAPTARRSFRYRIVKQLGSQRVTTDIDQDDEEFARKQLDWHRGVAPDTYEMFLERQELTPRPWERLDA